MNDKIRWGICGAGAISENFARTLRAIGGNVSAVASTSAKRAEEFATRQGIKKHYGAYGELAQDREIDAVYVANHHPDHANSAILMMREGKAVLVEKPMTINLSQFSSLAHCARQMGVLAMEAMWTRFLPATAKVLELVSGGAIGEIRYVNCRLGILFPQSVKRAFQNDLAGGALLDLGVYCLNYVNWILGDFTDIAAVEHTGRSSGVDEMESIVVKNAQGACGSILNAVNCSVGNGCTIYGSEGKLIVPEFNGTNEFTMERAGGSEKFSFQYPAGGYAYEIEHFEQLLREGKRESPLMPLCQTEKIINIMDGLRQAWQLRFRPHEA